MSPDGNIYTPEQVEELTKQAPGFASKLTELSESERKELEGLNRHERRAKLSQMRKLLLDKQRDFTPVR